MKDFTVIAGGRTHRAQDLCSAVSELDPADVSLAAVHVPDGPLTVASLLWAWNTVTDIVFLHGETASPEATALARRLGCSHMLTAGVEGSDRPPLRLECCNPDAPARQPGPVRIGLLTSGTTGEPKHIVHTRESLAASIAIRPELQSARWISLYPLTRFAGFNTLLHVVLNGATLIVPEAFHPAAILEEIGRSRPTHASGTPTLWRNLLMSAPERVSSVFDSVRQITLGGEVVDQQILSALKSSLPHVRLTHIYASTELGVCVAVSDGHAGFPAEWLGDSTKHVQLQVRGDELWIKPKAPADRIVDCGGWAPTGDVVEIRNGRVFFKGRRSDVLNIGGAKILPSEVEEKIAEVPGVIGVRVTGRRNSLSGVLVVADIVAAPAQDQAALRIALNQHCRATLPRYAVPRLINFVEALPTASSGKILRERSGSE